MRFIKPAAAILAVAMASTAFVPAAVARDNHYYRHGNYHGNYHGGYHGDHRRGGFDAFGAGIAGFGAGAFLGSLAQPDYYPGYYNEGYAPQYYQQPTYYYAPAPVYVAPPRAYYRQQPAYNGCDSGSGTSRPATSMC